MMMPSKNHTSGQHYIRNNQDEGTDDTGGSSSSPCQGVYGNMNGPLVATGFSLPCDPRYAISSTVSPSSEEQEDFDPLLSFQQQVAINNVSASSTASPQPRPILEQCLGLDGQNQHGSLMACYGFERTTMLSSQQQQQHQQPQNDLASTTSIEPIPRASMERVNTVPSVSVQDNSWFDDLALKQDIVSALQMVEEGDSGGGPPPLPPNVPEETQSTSTNDTTNNHVQYTNNNAHAAASAASTAGMSNYDWGQHCLQLHNNGYAEMNETTRSHADSLQQPQQQQQPQQPQHQLFSYASTRASDLSSCDDDDTGGGGDDDDNHPGKWQEKFEEIVAFKRIHGHCNVRQSPSLTDPSIIALALWVKRQRYHYKRKQNNKKSSLRPEREQALTQLGFVWNIRGNAWDDKLDELRDFVSQFGHANVPIDYANNRRLGIWIKGQRHQYKLYEVNDPRTTLNPDRIAQLEELGMLWNPPRGRKKLSSRRQRRKEREGDPTTTTTTTTTNEDNKRTAG